MDEPTAALGVRQAGRVELVKELRVEGHTILLVSHNMDNVFELADRVVVLRLGKRIELASRRVRLCGVTANADSAWVTQQARNLIIRLDDEGVRVRYLIRDRDNKFTRDFDEVFRGVGIRVLRAPVRAPRARAHAERWVGSLRRECLDRLLIFSRRHLEHVLRVYRAITTGIGRTARSHFGHPTKTPARRL